jgi:hypothetical protein
MEYIVGPMIIRHAQTQINLIVTYLMDQLALIAQATEYFVQLKTTKLAIQTKANLAINPVI